jgi:hypothetical protein
MTAPRADASAAAQAKPRGGSSWGARSSNRDGGKLKLMGSLRGAGLLTLADQSIPAAYELDIYARSGATRSASGHLEGAFAALVDGEARTGRLRLSDGVEFDIELTDLESDLAEFETRGDLPAAVSATARGG